MSIKNITSVAVTAALQSQRSKAGGSENDDFASRLESLLAQSKVSQPSQTALEARLLILTMTRSLLSDDSSDQDYFPRLPMSVDAGFPGSIRPLPSCQNYGNPARPFDAIHQTTGLKSVPPSPSQAPDLENIIERAAGTHGIDPQLIRAVIKTESAFDPQALSPVGAQGLMQLMPETARELGVTDPFDPEQNVMAGTRYLRQLLDRYEGDLDRALAAYNWGMGNLERKGLEQMPRETRNYLTRIKGAGGFA